jgi:hypothetical protein
MQRSRLLGFISVGRLHAQDGSLTRLGSYREGARNEAAAEIVAHSTVTDRLFALNGAKKTADILDARNPLALTRIGNLSIPPEAGVAAQSFAVQNGIVAIAVEASLKAHS